MLRPANKITFGFSKKTFLVLALVQFFTCSQAQSKSSVFEYVSAEYRSGEKITVILVRDQVGEIYQLQFSDGDTIKSKQDLYTDPDQLGKKLPVMNVTRSDLKGKKFTFVFEPVGPVDPANPYCCYKIREFQPL